MVGRKGFLLALIASAAITTRAPAQHAQPEQRVGEFFEALAGKRWTEAARLIHPARLESFQDAQVSLLIAVARRHEQLRKEGIAHRVEDDFNVALDPVLEPKMLAQYSNVPIGGVGRARTIGGASALPAAEFMAHWLAARVQDPDSLYRRRFANVPRSIVGGVIEDDSVAHVLYRVDRAYQYTMDPADVEIMRLRKLEGQWYLWPDADSYDFRTGVFLRLQYPATGSGHSGRDQPPRH